MNALILYVLIRLQKSLLLGKLGTSVTVKSLRELDVPCSEVDGVSLYLYGLLKQDKPLSWCLAHHMRLPTLR